MKIKSHKVIKPVLKITETFFHQVAEIRSWDSTIEILSVTDIRTSIEGSKDLSPGDRLALAVGAVVRVKSLPRSTWKAYGDDSFEVTPNGEIRALSPGHGVIIAYHKDDRNNIYRETVSFRTYINGMFFAYYGS